MILRSFQVIIFSFCFFCFVNSYTIELSPGGVECFFEKLIAKNEITVIFEVLRGGDLDVKVQIFSPQGQLLFEELHHENDEEAGEHDFSPEETGPYEICFDNKMSTFTTKVIEFYFLKEDLDAESEEVLAHKLKPALTDDIEFIEGSLEKIQKSMNQLETNIIHMKMRDSQHKEIIASTSQRLMWVSILESVLLLAMNVFQIFYLRRSLDPRSKIRY